MGILCKMRIQLGLLILSGTDSKPISEVADYMLGSQFGDNFFKNLSAFNETGYNMPIYNSTQDIFNQTEGERIGSIVEAMLPSMLQSIFSAIQPSKTQANMTENEGVNNLISKFEDLGKEYALNDLKTGATPKDVSSLHG